MRDKRARRPVSRVLFDAFQKRIGLQHRKTHEEKKNDTNEILPVRSSTFTVGKSDGYERRTLHDPGERVPHERLENEIVSLFWTNRE